MATPSSSADSQPALPAHTHRPPDTVRETPAAAPGTASDTALGLVFGEDPAAALVAG